jgi:microcystin-dependent protein
MPVTNKNSGVAAGVVMYFAARTAPVGWLKANGELVSRTSYAALFAVIGTTFGAGDGSTTFALPDLRGEFVRCLDDGRGVDSGRGIGTSQNHGVKIDGTINTVMSTNASATGAFSYSRNSYSTATDGPARESGNFTLSGGSNETRPRNIALLACIKY